MIKKDINGRLISFFLFRECAYSKLGKLHIVLVKGVIFMVNYPGRVPNPVYLNGPRSDDRQFLFPFLGGALIGGAAVGLTRPRPIYNVAPYPYPPAPMYPPYAPYPRPYTNMSYSYNSFQ